MHSSRQLAVLSVLATAGCELAPIELMGQRDADPGADVAVPDVGPELPEPDSSAPIFPTARRFQVELTWRRAGTQLGGGSPGGGLDPGDGFGKPSGADLDLHYLHPFAVGRDLDDDGVADGWFDIPFDVHWNNAEPSWDAPGVADDGRLDRDDREGPGPEVVTLDRCDQDGFRIGVHHFADDIGTPSVARVSVYVDDQRTFMAEATLWLHDLWEVGVMRCDGQVEAADGGRTFPGVVVAGPGW
ncbi:MAG TPA: hypothetical protein PK095_24825 [Myxococcota bacterium]|nr:hypothetical protein [Myxococcota bacterium]